jgi:phosphoglycolate phosphatase-like HAD superfamily hydrolase
MDQPSGRAQIDQVTDPLPSWNHGLTKRAIVEFVTRVTKPDSLEFVPLAERIALFDNDGTLWAEQPTFVQALFALDRIRQLAPQHPEWKTREPFASVLRGDAQSALTAGMQALVEMAMASHAGTTTEEFEAIVRDWISAARHPKTGKLYTDMVYQPMLELLAYLRANGFKTFIASAGGIEFMRVFSERVYGVPPEQVIGTSIRTKFELREGRPVLVRLPEINFVDDGDGKPVGIQMHIGRRPVAAFGNADGDLQMLQWTAAGSGLRFCLYVHHTDADREWAYDRKSSSFGQLDKGLDEARARGWTLVDMKNDWNTIFPFETLSPVTAIDILLEPDSTMTKNAEAANARLRESFPAGFALDETHQPHISCLQRYVRTADLAKVYEAVGKVLAEENPTGWKLKAYKYCYLPWKNIGLAGIVIEPTDDLIRFQQNLTDAVAPFTEQTGTAEAFVTTKDDPEINQPTIDYVAGFVPNQTGEKFNPHVSVGIASQDYLKRMLAEKYEAFTFSLVGVSVYQLGNMGTARKKLKSWELKPEVRVGNER